MNGTTPKQRQYRTTEEPGIGVDGTNTPEWPRSRIEALQDGEEGPEWVTVGFISPLGVYEMKNNSGYGKSLSRDLPLDIDRMIDSPTNPHRLVFTGLWLPPAVE